MTETLTTALEQAEQPKDTRSVLDLINTLRPEVERSLQSEAGADILVRHYYSAIRYNPLLRQCTADSLVAALLLSAQVRLEPGPLGHVYLVPFKNGKTGAHEVVWMLGYTGIIELGRRGGAVGLRASVVWDADEFEPPWENERGLHWKLIPGPADARTSRVGALVIWKDGGERTALFMPPERIDAAIAASRNPRKEDLRLEDWYWRKTAVRFARPWLPISGPEFGRAAHADGGRVYAVEVEQGEAQAAIDAPDEP
jgi:recombination protein RecT